MVAWRRTNQVTPSKNKNTTNQTARKKKDQSEIFAALGIRPICGYRKMVRVKRGIRIYLLPNLATRNRRFTTLNYHITPFPFISFLPPLPRLGLTKTGPRTPLHLRNKTDAYKNPPNTTTRQIHEPPAPLDSPEESLSQVDRTTSKRNKGQDNTKGESRRKFDITCSLWSRDQH